MKVRALKDFVSPVLGNVDEGKVLDLEDRTATNWIGAGLVEDAAIVHEQPKAMPPPDFVSPDAPSSALPPAPASPQTIANKSGNGGKRGRPRKIGG